LHTLSPSALPQRKSNVCAQSVAPLPYLCIALKERVDLQDWN
jgi:hypothetical protein